MQLFVVLLSSSESFSVHTSCLLSALQARKESGGDAMERESFNGEVEIETDQAYNDRIEDDSELLSHPNTAIVAYVRAPCGTQHRKCFSPLSSFHL